jgi:hypothetical protein
MAVDVTPVFAARLARNRGPDPNDPDRRQAPDYGVSASFEDGVVNLVLTFRSGSAYCCYEYGCHLDLSASRQWEWLRQELSGRGLAVPSRLKLQLEVVVEEGAIFFDLSKPDPTRRGWYAFARSAAHRYHASVEEAVIPA